MLQKEQLKIPNEKKRRDGDPPKGTSPVKYALWISGSYFFVSFFWILFSSKLAGLIASDAATLASIETLKGWFFVTATAALLFWHIKKHFTRAILPQQDLSQMVSIRTAELENTAANLIVIMQQKDELLKQTERQQHFHSAVIKLSQEFFNVPLSQMNAALDDSLSVIGEYLGAERVAYAEHNKDGKLFVMGQWAKEQKLTIQELEEHYNNLRRSNTRYSIRQGMEFFEPFSSFNNTEASFNEEVYFRVHAPVHFLGKPCGSVMIATKKRTEEWTDEDIGILNIFIEMLRNAYVRRRQEIELEKANKLMRVMLDATEDSIYVIDSEGILHNANNGFVKLFDSPYKDVAGKNLSDFLPKSDFRKMMSHVCDALTNSLHVMYRVEFRGQWLENNIYPVADEDGNFTLAAVFCQDITKRMQYESELFRSRELFKKLIESAPVGIFWRDLNGVYLGANKQMADNFGTTVEALVGDKSIAYITREEHERQSRIEEDMFQKRLPRVQVQQNITRLDGEVRLFSVNKVPLINENGEPYGLLGVAEDITDRRREELELIEAKSAAYEANAAKSMFLSRMSHEIRTPLNSIIGLSHIAAQAKDASIVKDYISQIGVSSRHLLELINDILDISRIEAGKISIQKERFDLIGALESAVGMLLPRADEKRQKVDLYISSDVPRYVAGDSTRFKQVLVNLLGNAVKFTQEGGAISVHAKLQRDTDNRIGVSFTVRDNGIGIDAEHLKSIFEPFAQADSTFSRAHEGTGLGLPICKNIVDLMGGSITVNSTIGEGSEFTFVLPFEQAFLDGENAAPSFDDLHILVVDDELETRTYMKMLLTQYKVNTELAASGEEAVRAVCTAKEKGFPFNVVFVDMRMPGMNGIETAQAIRQNCGERVIVIMFSMYEWDDIEKSAREAGVRIFLPKPVFPSKLMDILCDITGGKHPDESGKTSIADGSLDGKRILVAEDNAINQLILREMLAKSGAVLVPVNDGRQALETFLKEQGAFDAILMDIQMPGMDGLEVTRIIRSLPIENAKHIPILAMTANVFREDIEKAMLAGMDAHIGKPIEPEDLVGKLKKYIGA